MATLEIFPTCYHMDHRTIPIGATCRFCKSPPYPGPNGAPSTPAETVTPAPLGLTDPPVSTQSSHLPHRPSIMLPDAATAPHSGLAGTRIRRTAFRPKLPRRIQSSTSILADADPPQPAAEIIYLFAVAIAIGHWPSEDALECRFTPLENKASAEISGNKDIFCTPEPGATTANPVEESTPEPSAATANHRRGISDVTTRSEREQQHEQERPAVRRGGRRVGASELVGLGI